MDRQTDISAMSITYFYLVKQEKKAKNISFIPTLVVWVREVLECNIRNQPLLESNEVPATPLGYFFSHSNSYKRAIRN